MNCASEFAYLKRKKVAPLSKPIISAEMSAVNFEDADDDEVDTNVISLDFKALPNAMQSLSFGDPFFCSKCKATLTSLSLNSIYTREKYQNFNSQNKNGLGIIPEEEEKDQSGSVNISKPSLIHISDLKSNESVWVCEFCGTHNKISIENEELPKADDLFYMLQSAEQNKIAANQTPNSKEQDISVIFCIDFSGSMCVTSEIKVKEELKYGGLSKEEYDMLKKFIEQGASQNLPKQKQGMQWVSRKQCVLAAIESQLDELKKSHPNRKVAVVAFNDEVILYGDGSSDPVIVTGDKLNKKDVCLSIGTDSDVSHLTRPISDSGKRLIEKLYTLKENGKTALGPAIALSLGLASKGKPGSTVIICTDGLANVGIGDLDNPKSTSDNFYEDMGVYAKERGIMINVITIKGEGCKVEKLGQLADLTQGKVIRVNPDNITSEFASIMKDEIVGTQVEVKVRLHPALKFRNEEEECLSENKSVYIKNIGNVTAGTTLTFEYQAKNDSELQKEGINLNNIKEVPLQATITYISKQGNKILRIITKKQLTTEDRKIAEKNVKVKLLATRATQKTSVMAGKGSLKKAQNFNAKWDSYLSNDIAESNAGDESFKRGLGSWKTKSSELQDHLSKRMKRMEKVEEVSKQSAGGGEGLKVTSSEIKSGLNQTGKELSKEIAKTKPISKEIMKDSKKITAPKVEKQKIAPISKPQLNTSKPIVKRFNEKMPLEKTSKMPLQKVSKKEIPKFEEEGSSDEENTNFYQLKQAKCEDFE